MRDRKRGSALLWALLASVVGAGMIAALSTLAMAQGQATRRALDQELAYQSAQSGVAYYVAALTSDVDFLKENPAPHAPVAVGNGTFRLLTAQADLSGSKIEIRVRGSVGGEVVDLMAILGYRVVNLPNGLIVNGSEDPDVITMEIEGGSGVGSYHPDDGAFSLTKLRDNGEVTVNGTLEMNGGTEIHGEVTASGSIVESNNTLITGESESYGLPAVIPNINTFVADRIQETNDNDNANLEAIFGTSWRPVPGTSYGDLVVEGPGRFVIPSGTYQFRDIHVYGGAEVVFDTSVSATTIAVLGEDQKASLYVQDESRIVVDPGESENGLTTLLGADTNMMVQANSEFGRALGKEDQSRYQLLLGMEGGREDATVNIQANSSGYGTIYTRGHYLDLGGNCEWYGAGIVGTASIHGSMTGGAYFMIDESLGGRTFLDDSRHFVLAQWRVYPQVPGVSDPQPVPEAPPPVPFPVVSTASY